MKALRKVTSPSLLIAALALFVALGGTSYAAKLITGAGIKNSSLTGADVKNSSLTTSDVKNGSLLKADFKAGQLSAGPQGSPGAVGPAGAPGAAGAPGPAGTAPPTKVIARKRVVATDGATEAIARAAAPEVELFSRGSLTVYGKCSRQLDTNRVRYGVFLKTSQNGVIFDSRSNTLDGGPAATDFLNTNTLETDAELEGDSVLANNATMDSEDDSDFTVFAPDGTTLRGFTGGAVKNGTLPGGNGAYGDGNVCLFTGVIIAD